MHAWSMSRTDTRPEQNIYKVLITCFPELLLKGQVLTTSLNSKVQKAKIGRNGKFGVRSNLI